MFLKVFRSLETFRGESGIRTWLDQITLNHCRNLRSGWYRRTMVNNVEDAIDAGPSALSDDPIRVLESKELGELIRQTLDQLPADQRLVLLLAAVLTGIARNALNDAVAYTRHHARPIKHSTATKSVDDPYVRHVIGEISARAATAEAIVLAASDRIDASWAGGHSPAPSPITIPATGKPPSSAPTASPAKPRRSPACSRPANKDWGGITPAHPRLACPQVRRVTSRPSVVRCDRADRTQRHQATARTQSLRLFIVRPSKLRPKSALRTVANP